MPLQFDEIRLGPLRLVDLSSMRDKVQAQTLRTAGEELLKSLIAQTRTTRLCDTGLVGRREREAWEALVEVEGAAADRAEFLATFDPGLDNADCDIRLPTFALAVHRNREFLGVFFLYNVKITSETRAEVRAMAYAAPALSFDRRDETSWVRVVRLIMGGFLKNDLALKDGRQFVLEAWKFPTDKVDHRWSGESWAESLMSDLTADGGIQETKDGVVRKVRRRLVEEIEPSPLPRRR